MEVQMKTNVHSAYYLTKQLLELMLPHRAGHIFNLCSVASLQAYPNGGAYSISKFALLGFTKALREELKEHNIRVTALNLGADIEIVFAAATAPRTPTLRACPPA